MDYLFEDYRDAFLVSADAMIQRHGIQMASDGHFETLATNCDGAARALARRLAIERQKFEPKAPKKAAIKLPSE